MAKVGIVGFGKMGILHGALINKIDGIEVSAITDSSKVITNVFSSVLPNIRFYNSYDKMLDNEKLDAILITTPSFSHTPIAIKALKNNIGVFIEKPLSNTLKNALSIKEALKGKNVAVKTGFHMRYVPTIAKGKYLLDDNIVGKIHSINAKLYVSYVFAAQKGWRYDPEISGGGVVIDFTIHLLDILHWYFGNVNTIKAHTERIHSNMVEDEVTAKIQFDNDMTASLHSSWSIPGYRLPLMEIDVAGEDGILKINDHGISLFDRNGSKKYHYSIADLYKGYFFDIAGAHYSLQMESFASALKSGHGSSEIDDAIYAQRLVDAIYRSSDHSVPVQV